MAFLEYLIARASAVKAQQSGGAQRQERVDVALGEGPFEAARGEDDVPLQLWLQLPDCVSWLRSWQRPARGARAPELPRLPW